MKLDLFFQQTLFVRITDFKTFHSNLTFSLVLSDEPQVWDGVGEGGARGRGKESPANAGDTGSILGLGRSPEEENGNPFLPGKSHGYWNLAGYSLWFCKQWDMT